MTTRALAAGLSAATLAIAAPATAQPIEMIVPEGHDRFVETFKAAPVTRVGDTIYISGVVGGVRPDQEKTPETYEAAIRSAFERVGAMLAAAGASWDDVAHMTTYHVDMRSHQDIVVRVREEFVGDPPYPAWTSRPARRR